jgi:hypothetical protein
VMGGSGRVLNIGDPYNIMSWRGVIEAPGYLYGSVFELYC